MTVSMPESAESRHDSKPSIDEHPHPMDEEMELSFAEIGGDMALSKKRSRITQACDTCRRRKVRCSGIAPCESCVEHKIKCVFGEPKKRGPKTGSRHTSSQRVPVHQSFHPVSRSFSDGEGCGQGPPSAALLYGDSFGAGLGPASNSHAIHPGYSALPLESSRGAPQLALASEQCAPWTMMQGRQRADPDPDPESEESACGSLCSSGLGSPVLPPVMAPPASSHSRTPRSAFGFDGSLLQHADTDSSSSSSHAHVGSVDRHLAGHALSREEVEELSEHITVLVSLDNEGRPRGFQNLGESSGMHVLRSAMRRGLTKTPGRGPGASLGQQGAETVDGEADSPARESQWASDAYVFTPIIPMDCVANQCDLDRALFLFPNRMFVEMLLDFYHDQLSIWGPVIPRLQTDYQLYCVGEYLQHSGRGPVTDETGRPVPKPCFMLLYALLYFSAIHFERRYKLIINDSDIIAEPAVCRQQQGGAPLRCPSFPASRILCSRAKQSLATMLSNCLPCIEAVQTCYLIDMADLSSVYGNPWLLMGMSVRIATQLGLHLGVSSQISELVATRMSGVWGLGIQAAASRMLTHAKAWVVCYSYDRILAFSWGRPAAIHDDDCVVDVDTCTATPENCERFAAVADELLPQDDFFVWLVKIADIMGKVARTVGNIRLRKKLFHTLPELHGMLVRYQAELPPALRFKFEAKAKNSVQAAYLTMLYYMAVIGLYRPLLTSKVLQYNRKVEYVAILTKSVGCICDVIYRHRHQLGEFPTPMGNQLTFFFVCCVAVMQHDPDHVGSRRRILRLLEKTMITLDSLEKHSPVHALKQRAVCAQLMAFAKDESVSPSAQGTVDRLRNITDRMIAAERNVVAAIAAGPANEREAAESSFAFLSHHASTRPRENFYDSESNRTTPLGNGPPHSVATPPKGALASAPAAGSTGTTAGLSISAPHPQPVILMSPSNDSNVPVSTGTSGASSAYSHATPIASVSIPANGLPGSTGHFALPQFPKEFASCNMADLRLEESGSLFNMAGGGATGLQAPVPSPISGPPTPVESSLSGSTGIQDPFNIFNSTCGIGADLGSAMNGFAGPSALSLLGVPPMGFVPNSTCITTAPGSLASTAPATVPPPRNVPPASVGLPTGMTTGPAFLPGGAENTRLSSLDSYNAAYPVNAGPNGNLVNVGGQPGLSSVVAGAPPVVLGFAAPQQGSAPLSVPKPAVPPQVNNSACWTPYPSGPFTSAECSLGQAYPDALDRPQRSA